MLGREPAILVWELMGLRLLFCRRTYTPPMYLWQMPAGCSVPFPGHETHNLQPVNMYTIRPCHSKQRHHLLNLRELFGECEVLFIISLLTGFSRSVLATSELSLLSL